MERPKTQPEAVDKPLKQMGMGDLRLLEAQKDREAQAAKEAQERENQRRTDILERSRKEAQERAKEQDAIAIRLLSTPQMPIDAETMDRLQSIARSQRLTPHVVVRAGDENRDDEIALLKELGGKQKEKTQMTELIAREIKRRMSEIDRKSEEYAGLSAVLVQLDPIAYREYETRKYNEIPEGEIDPSH